MVIVLTGVSGSGKTTIGTRLAQRTGMRFADADDYHSPANKQKMAEGHPLDDADRQPWLQALNGLLQGWVREGKGGVLACSALKATYRDELAAGTPRGSIEFVLLEGSRELIAARLAARHHEYMNPNLLDSQFDTLERVAGAFSIVNDRSPDEVVDRILQHIHQEAS